MDFVIYLAIQRVSDLNKFFRLFIYRKMNIVLYDGGGGHVMLWQLESCQDGKVYDGEILTFHST